MKDWLFLIPLLPLLSSAIIGLANKRLPRALVNVLSPLAVFGSFLLTVATWLELKGMMAAQPEAAHRITQVLFTWFDLPTFKVELGFLFDPLTAVMALTVTGVGFLIHVYSVGYMGHEEDYPRYFSYLNLFTFFMLVLVTAKNLPLLFVGWEGVGLCSYLLIGFWFKEIKNAQAGKKAFIVNRVGDFGFLVGMILLGMEIFRASGVFSLDFVAMQGSVEFLGDAANSVKYFGVSLIGIACLALFVGATGKSAQIPLYVWLPDAMAGPTPVSALIHAATMVTAGVYMIGRLNYIFLLVPSVLTLVAWIGGLTALYAATIALTQYDIKKVLAWSTISQLGYMFMGMGVGAFSSGIFHLVTHAFFKGLLFLGAGAVIHALHHEQDMRKMGGLKNRIPVTFGVFAAGWFAICALPPGAGFHSKDMILHHAANSHLGGIPLFAIGLFTGGLTAFYMSRLFFYTFLGKCRNAHPEQIHENPLVMTLPMGILAVLSIVGGYISIPGWLGHFFADHAAEAAGHGGHAAELLSHGLVGAMSSVSALVGIALAWWLYAGDMKRVSRWKEKLSFLHNFSQRGYFIDELYHSLFAGGVVSSGRAGERFVDRASIDGVGVHGSAGLAMLIGRGTSRLQTGALSGYLLAFFTGTAALIYFLLY